MDEPGRDPGPGDVADQLLAPLDRPCWKTSRRTARARRFGPIGYRRVRYSRRAGRDVLAPAAACSQMQVMLDAARGRLGYLQLLERPGHAQILRAGQVCAARACPGRVMILHLVRLGPAHRRSRRAGLLAPLALGGGPFRSAPLPPRRLAARLVI